MQTAFITIELPLPPNPADLHAKIEAQLKTQGTPLRWSITHIETTETQRIAQIEAIVTTP
jgi:endonuclease/exonuclease/phosphatase family metal-dependent hydrolase